MMTEADAVALAEEKGLADGRASAPFSPPITPGICKDADDAYLTAYTYALAYTSPALDAR